MVLIQRLILVLPLIAGCKQSLFDADPGGPGGGPDGSVTPLACPAPCIADAAADFDGSPTGLTGHWRYLDDQRDRSWVAMAAAATGMTGADPANRIATCAKNPGAAACARLPGALLVSSAGATSAADPAIEFTATSAQVIRLSVRALLASGDDQTIRLYRNSREDVLFTGIANAGAELDHTITLDALVGDRFLVALAPTAKGAADVALQLFVSASGASFPSSCQLALPFEATKLNTTTNLCGGAFTHALWDGNADTPPVLTTGVYPELGKATELTSDAYFKGTGTLDKSHDLTVQFWVKHRAFINPYDAWLFSDLDLDVGAAGGGGGLGIAIINTSPPKLDVTTCTSAANPLKFADALAPYPTDESWQFVRVVHTGNSVNVCMNGKRVSSMAVPAGLLKSSFSPHIGRNVVWTPSGAFVDGLIDDLRVLTGALPCE